MKDACRHEAGRARHAARARRADAARRGRSAVVPRARLRDAPRTRSPRRRATSAALTVKELQQIAGIGKSTAEKIRELLETGRVAKLEALRAQAPAERRRAAAHSGPRAEGAREAARRARRRVDRRPAQRARRAPRARPRGLRREVGGEARARGRSGSTRRARSAARPISVALPLATRIVARLREVPGVSHASYCGSLRRFAETIGDIDIVVAASDPAPVMEALVSMSCVERVLARGESKTSVVTQRGTQVDLRVVAAAPARRRAALLHRLEGTQHQAAPARARARTHAERVRAVGDRGRTGRGERDRGADLRRARAAVDPARAARGRGRDRRGRGRAPARADRRRDRRLPRAHLALGRRSFDARGGGRRGARARVPRARDHRARRGNALGSLARGAARAARADRDDAALARRLARAAARRRAEHRPRRRARLRPGVPQLASTGVSRRCTITSSWIAPRRRGASSPRCATRRCG